MTILHFPKLRRAAMETKEYYSVNSEIENYAKLVNKLSKNLKTFERIAPKTFRILLELNQEYWIKSVGEFYKELDNADLEEIVFTYLSEDEEAYIDIMIKSRSSVINFVEYEDSSFLRHNIVTHTLQFLDLQEFFEEINEIALDK